MTRAAEETFPPTSVAVPLDQTVDSRPASLVHTVALPAWWVTTSAVSSIVFTAYSCPFLDQPIDHSLTRFDASMTEPGITARAAGSDARWTSL